MLEDTVSRIQMQLSMLDLLQEPQIPCGSDQRQIDDNL